MQAFTSLAGLVAPLDRANVDTDVIIPKQFLKSIKRTGFGPYAFDAWRYLDHGEPEMDCSGRPLNPDFVLNQARYQGARILLTRKNFGCGSSREHAPWALLDYGFRVLISPSFADIFYNNCFKNGILPIIQPESTVDRLFQQTDDNNGYALQIHLPDQTITLPDGDILRFDIDAFRKHALSNGLDEIGLTLQHVDVIRQYEQRRRQQRPWLFQREEGSLS